jgi:stage IV sporulation protein FB
MQFQRSYKICTIWGISVFIHWTAAALLILLILLALSGGIPLLFLAGSLIVVMLAHELGHASLARRLGYRVHSILLSPVHGQCFYDAPRSRYDECYVAWGGVSAQATILVPAAAIWSLAPTMLPNVLNLAFVMLTYYNAAVIVFNLTPLQPFDGATAWGLFRARANRSHPMRRRR